MKQRIRGYVLLAGFLWLSGCSVMPANIRKDALPGIPFNTLVRNASEYIDKTVIVGGYVVEVQNEPERSRLVAVQAPLGMEDEPRSRDLSQGRLIIEYLGFLDPEVYQKDREITVAGKLLGSSATEAGGSFPYIRVLATAIHLWEARKIQPETSFWPYHYPYPYPYYHPWGWYRPYP